MIFLIIKSPGSLPKKFKKDGIGIFKNGSEFQELKFQYQNRLKIFHDYKALSTKDFKESKSLKPTMRLISCPFLNI